MLKIRLVYLRSEKGLSQYEAAERLGFSRGKLANYEQGSRQPDYDTLQIIADFYDVTIDYLLGRTDSPKRTENDEKTEIIDKIAAEFPNADLMFHDLANMTAEELEDVYDYIKFKSRKKED